MHGLHEQCLRAVSRPSEYKKVTLFVSIDHKFHWLESGNECLSAFRTISPRVRVFGKRNFAICRKMLRGGCYEIPQLRCRKDWICSAQPQTQDTLFTATFFDYDKLERPALIGSLGYDCLPIHARAT